MTTTFQSGDTPGHSRLQTPNVPYPAPEDVEVTTTQGVFKYEPEHAMMPPTGSTLPGGLPPPPPKSLYKAGGMPVPPKAQLALPGQVPDSGAQVTSMALAPLGPMPNLPVAIPTPPPKGSPGAGQLAVFGNLPASAQLALMSPPESPGDRLAIAPLQSIPGGGRLPPLPKGAPIAIPKDVHKKIPAVQRDSGNALLPPPPPPPVGGFGQLAHRPIPPEEGQPEVERRLEPYKAGPRRGGPTGRLPRPPPKPPSVAMLPTPPSGPPPAHAIVLARKAGVPGFDQEEIVKKAKPPPVVPKPPQEPPPPGRGVPHISHKVVDDIAKKRKDKEKDIIQGVPDPFLAARRDPRAHVALGKKSHDEKAPVLVPDYVDSMCLYAVNGVLLGFFLCDAAILASWGTYLPPEAVYPTYAATIIGCLVNFMLFESVKCVVITCLAMVHDETEKRDTELRARRARMELKAQRFVQRGRHIQAEVPGRKGAFNF